MAGRLSRSIWIGALVTAVALLITFMVLANRFECAECTTESDCGPGFHCQPFDDGGLRCVDQAWVCQEGHVRLPTWAHGLLVGVAVVGVMAWAYHRQVYGPRR